MRIIYRPEIDGLRAIAVFAVIFYHLEISILGNVILKGGFIGVDIFFVISGYLISAIILKELEAKGSFSFLNFYERRARRLLPVLFFVILATTPFAFFYLISASIIDYSKSILYSIFFTSNFYFLFTKQLYADVSSLFKPFLHTWSLSVEEQFYILLPIIIVIAYKFIKKNLFILLIFLTLISYLSSIILESIHPSLSFYLIFSRGWELLFGVILSILENKYGRQKYQKFSNFFILLGFLLLFQSLFFFNNNMSHISIYLLSPIIGTSLIIWYSNKKNFFTRILSSKIFVSLGLISYSLYLWHYPIFAFARVTNYFQNNFIFILLIILITIILSVLSYFYIEKPFRNKEKTSLKIFISFIVIFFIFILSFIFLSFNEKGFYKRYVEVDNYIYDNSYFLDQWRKYENEIGTPKFENLKKINILIVGDSNGRDLFNAINLNKNLFHEYEFSFYRDQISDFFEIINAKEKKEIRINIENFFNNSIQHNLKNADYIILSYEWNDSYLESLETSIKEVENKNRIIIAGNTPHFPIHTHDIHSFTIVDKFVFDNKRLPNNKEKINLEELYYQKNDRHFLDLNNRLKVISDKYNITYLEKNDYVCNKIKKRCDFFTESNNKIYWDSGHYTLQGAKYLGKKIYEQEWLFIN